MKRVKKLSESLSRFLSVIGTMSLVFIMMYIVCSVLSRFLTGKPLLGTFELGSTFLPLIAAFYYGNTEIYGRHIRATIIFERFSSRSQHVLDALYALIGALIFVIVSWRVALFGMRNLQMNAETSVLGLPTAPFLFVYSVLLLNYSIYLFIKAADHSGQSLLVGK